MIRDIDLHRSQRFLSPFLSHPAQFPSYVFCRPAFPLYYFVGIQTIPQSTHCQAHLGAFVRCFRHQGHPFTHAKGIIVSRQNQLGLT
jgi:hypothetical protein